MEEAAIVITVAAIMLWAMLNLLFWIKDRRPENNNAQGKDSVDKPR